MKITSVTDSMIKIPTDQFPRECGFHWSPDHWCSVVVDGPVDDDHVHKCCCYARVEDELAKSQSAGGNWRRKKAA
jgi:predicted DNA-binding protein (MmcQ/YjbR family)